MILEINAGLILGILIGFFIGLITGASTFAVIVYFPDMNNFWKGLKFIYEFRKELREENKKSKGVQKDGKKR